MTSYRQSMKDTLELMNLMREAKLLERDLTPDEEKRREEIAKDLPDDDFKKRYGDKWMQVKMATATKMMKKEEVDLDEAKFSAKEIKMAIGIASDKRYKGGNMTGAADAIDKIKPGLSDHPQVRAVLRRQNEETELDEVGGSAFGGTIDKIQKVVDDKQATKIDGVMVDTFTASLIMNIFNKVNKQNQDKMRKMKVTQLANAAYKLAGVKEEVELDEKVIHNVEFEFQVDMGIDERDAMEKTITKFAKKHKLYRPERDMAALEKTRRFRVSDYNGGKDVNNFFKDLQRAGVKVIKQRMIGNNKSTSFGEEVELDEAFKVGDKVKVKKGTMKSPSQRHYEKTVGTIVKDYKDGDFKINFGGNDDLSIEGKFLVKEELELDEGKMGDQWQKGAKSVKSGPFELMRGKSGVHAIMQNGKKLGDFSYDDDADNFVANMKGMKGQWTGNDIDSLFTHLQKVHKEEVELDEGKMSQLHQHIKDKKSPEEIAKLMKLDVKTIKALMNSHHPEEVEESKTTVPMSTKAGQSVKKGQVPKGMYGNAARDARRAMGRDPEMRQRAFSKDDSASDDDQKGASKNIIMQLRKAGNRASMGVEFQDGKKIQIPAKLAMAVQQKYNSLPKPADKEKFQSKIAKSYRDMLNALKEEAVSPAQQAAIAISKKERGEKPKKESILDRIDRKIKENKNG